MTFDYKWFKDSKNKHWRIDQRMISRIPVYRPVDERFPISSPFGVTRTLTINGEKITRVHKGVDFSVPEKTEVFAMLSGNVHKVGFENPLDEKQGYGYRIIQRAEYNGQSLWLYYGHLSWSMVHDGYDVNMASGS